MVLEHLTTREAVEAVLEGDARIGGTVTPQHLLVNRNAMLAGGIRPHLYCLPILKTEDDRQALLGAVTSGCERIFLGTDSAPHTLGSKLSACGCAGVYSAHAALELYATAFEEAGALDKLEAFASVNGPNFYGMPLNESTITIAREPWTVPATYPFGRDVVVPLRSGTRLEWHVRGAHDESELCGVCCA